MIGGGAGGATAAHYVKTRPGARCDADRGQFDLQLVVFSNLYIGGFRSLELLNHTYGGLQRIGVKVVHDMATDVDTRRKTVRTRGGLTYHYDRLVLSPGIDIKYELIPGYSRDAARIMPHAYTTDAQQKRLLKRQLQGMRDWAHS